MLLSVLVHGALSAVLSRVVHAPPAPGQERVLAVRLVVPAGPVRPMPEVLASVPAAAGQPKPAR